MTPMTNEIVAVDRSTTTSVRKPADAKKGKGRKKPAKKRDTTKNASSGTQKTPISKTIAKSKSAPKGRVAAVRKIDWANAGRTADGNSFSMKRIRNGDSRTLIVGSLRGFDPPAIAMMDQLAEHLEYNAAILGEMDCVLLRTANPDGLAHRAVTTSGGLELKNAFPENADARLNADSSQAEVRFLVRLLKQFKPHRVIVIGQSENASGGIVYSATAKQAARDFADSVELADYPLDAREQVGSLERFAVATGAEVVSVQLPNSTTVESGWPWFGVWLPALLANGDSDK